MAKKAKKKTTTKIRSVGAAPAAASAAAAEAPQAPAADAELTPRGYIESALALAVAAHEKFELAVAALNDARPFFNAMDEVERHKHGKAIQDFVNKSGFGLTSLADEVRILLGRAPAELAPKARLEIPTALTPRPAGEERGSLADLQKSHRQFSFALKVVANTEILAAQSEAFGENLKFLKGFVDQLELEIARAS